MRQIRGLVRAWHTKVRNLARLGEQDAPARSHSWGVNMPLACLPREAGVLDAAAVSSRLKRAKKWPPEGGHFLSERTLTLT